MKAKRVIIGVVITAVLLCAAFIFVQDVIPMNAFSKRHKRFDRYMTKKLSDNGDWELGVWRKKRLEMSTEEYAKLKEELLQDGWYDETHRYEDGISKPSESDFTEEERNGMQELLAHVYTPCKILGEERRRDICERLYVMTAGGKVILEYEAHLTQPYEAVKW